MLPHTNGENRRRYSALPRIAAFFQCTYVCACGLGSYLRLKEIPQDKKDAWDIPALQKDALFGMDIKVYTEIISLFVINWLANLLESSIKNVHAKILYPLFLHCC